MITRSAKVLLLAGVGFYFALVVFNNLTDYDSNYQFVRHVLMMDTTFSGNQGMWRALNQPAIHTVAYISLIAWEFASMLLCVWGAWRLARSLRQDANAFNSAKRIPILG